MSDTARQTILRCSDWKCIRTTVNAYRQTVSDGKPNPPSLSTILCNVHAGAQRRSWYRDDPLMLTDEDRTRLLAAQAKVDEQDAKDNEQKDKENAERNAKRHAEEWATLNDPAQYAIVQHESYSAEEEPTFEGEVFTTAPTYPGDARWFSIEPSQRYYRALRNSERAFPYYIRVTRGASLTPNEARALAAALTEGAAKAEQLNESRKPNG